jgi:hypothetical protein
MSKTERFALGIALMTAALTVILQAKFWAWFLFTIGLCFVIIPVLLDWRYGDRRPSRAEIEEMPADQYEKLLRNRKSKRWIDLLDRWPWNKKHIGQY